MTVDWFALGVALFILCSVLAVFVWGPILMSHHQNREEPWADDTATWREIVAAWERQFGSDK